MIERRKKLTATIGILAVGLDTYWQQFPGLLDNLNAKTDRLVQKIRNLQADVVSFGMVDNACKAYEVLPSIKAADPDILFVHMATYATSSTFGAIVRDLTCPVILVALQPMQAMDYARGTTFMQLCNDDLCAVPEFTGVAIRMGHPVADVIIGTESHDPSADAELEKWCRIAFARHDLRHARFGLMGHVLESMLDMHTDATKITATFGAHVVQCEAEDIYRHLKDLDSQTPEVKAMSAKILAFFDTPTPVSDPLTSKLTDEDLLTSSRIAVALNRFIQEKRLDGFAYYYESEPGSDMRRMVTNFIVGNSMLTSEGFPMCGECDLKTCIAMMIMDRLDIGGSFAEFHPIDFRQDTVLVGHDGPHHLNIANGRPALRSLSKYHGKVGSGAGVEFNIKTGPITILSIGVKADGNFKFVLAEGESMPGPIPPTGNTNTHGKFPPDVRTFLKRWCLEGPTHHFALGIGHHAHTIAQIARSFGVEAVIV